MNPIHFAGRNGFGDAIYTRAVMQSAIELHDVYLSTAWPEIFADLPVRCVKPVSTLYGPNANVAKYPERYWVNPPPVTPSRNLKYAWKRLHKTNLLRQIEIKAQIPIAPFRFDVPLALPDSPVRVEKLAIIRPVTIRKDWPNQARNPDPAYIYQAAQLLANRGYYVVSVADIQPMEILVGGAPQAQQRYEHGELHPLELLALIREATVVVGGVGWIVPACIATGTPLIVIGGGRGGCDAPHCLIDSRMDKTMVEWILPDNYCRCTSRHHRCVKRISGFNQQFLTALRRLPVGSPAC
jgi:hypothetical protein